MNYNRDLYHATVRRWNRAKPGRDMPAGESSISPIPHQSKGVIRGPDGKFQSVDSAVNQFDELEYIRYSAVVTVEASESTGSTDGFYPEGGFFEGLQLVDFDEVLDRAQVGHVIRHMAQLDCMPTPTQTADGAARAMVQHSFSPANQGTINFSSGAQTDDIGTGAVAIVANAVDNDTADVLGRNLVSIGTGPFSDSATGVGGGGGSDMDSVDYVPMDVTVDARDELFLNGVVEISNISDTSVGVATTGYIVLGVRDR